MALVIPAIDLRNGRCIYLHQRSHTDGTTYFADPVKMAKLWRVQNARVLHVIDLNAARPSPIENTDNCDEIASICQAVDIPVQVGGGLHSLEEIQQMLDLGAYRVVVGSAAVEDPDLISQAIERYGCRRVVVSIDAKKGEVQVQSRTKGSGKDAIALALEMEQRGCRRIVYTDTVPIGRDGTMGGPNLESYRTLGKHLSEAKITASGISGYKDLLRIQELAPYRVDSVIIDRALYENSFPCQQFWGWHDLESIDLDHFSTAQLRAE